MTIAPRPVAPHGIIVERLDALLAAALDVPGIDAAIVRTLEETASLARGLEPYLGAHTTTESAELARLVADTQAENWDQRFADGETRVALEQEMVSGHLEGQFLKILIGAMRATRVLEIGLFTGYSALAMAEALPDHGSLVACEIDPYAAAFARRAFDRSTHGRKIRVEIGDAVETMKRLGASEAPFDLIFIDADKPNYPTYFSYALAGTLLAPHGLICVDNTLMQGKPYTEIDATPNSRAIAAFNRLVTDDPRVEQVMLPLRDGLTLIRRT